MVLGLQEVHGSEYSLRDLFNKAGVRAQLFASFALGEREGSGGVATLFPRFMGPGDVLWQDEAIIPGRVLRVAAAYYEDVRERRGRKVFVHWNVHNFDLLVAVVRQVQDRI